MTFPNETKITEKKTEIQISMFIDAIGNLYNIR